MPNGASNSRTRSRCMPPQSAASRLRSGRSIGMPRRSCCAVGHMNCARHRVRQRADRRHDVLDEERERTNVVFAVIQNGRALRGRERRTLDDPVAHVGLVRGVNSVLAEIAQRAVEAEKALCRDRRFWRRRHSCGGGIRRRDRARMPVGPSRARCGSRIRRSACS